MIHLNVRSAYSLMQSTIRLEQYVAQMAERGSRAVALADDALYGLPQFVRLCERYAVKPVIGLRTTLRMDGFDVSVLVYALTDEQVPELYRIVQA
ncbi:MAG: PHP domain-containing protein, partial [Exiguobacterium chiriqhucha]